MPINDYSPAWFDTFLRPYWPHQTEKELDFLARHLPLPSYRALLDICCGLGRHALPLAVRGYVLTGVDRDAAMIAEAHRAARDLPAAGAGSASFIEADMRNLAAIPGVFDGALHLFHCIPPPRTSLPPFLHVCSRLLLHSASSASSAVPFS